MKILLVNDCAPGLDGSGGVETHIRQLKEALEQRGMQSGILAHQRRGLAERQDGNLFLIPDLNAQPTRKHFLQNRKNRQAALEKARGIIQRFNPDVIHIHNLMNPHTLRMLRECAPVVKSIHDCRPFCAKPYPVVASRLIGDTQEFCDITMGKACWKRCYACAGHTAMERIEAWTYFRPNLQALEETLRIDQLVVYSRYLKELALRRFEDERRVHIVHHFTDAEKAAEHHTPQPEERPVFLFAGRLSPEKGILHIFEALKQIPKSPLKLIIAGDGPTRDEVERQTAACSAHHEIEMTGFVDQAKLYDLYRHASALIFPSIGSEGCPLTGIEAMYFGLPAIGYDAGGVGEWLVDGETGILLERADIPGLARAIKQLAADPQQTAKLGRQARAFVQQKFRREKHIDQLIEIYKTAQTREESPPHEDR